jgi:Tol biopolymer transport system component
VRRGLRLLVAVSVPTLLVTAATAASAPRAAPAAGVIAVSVHRGDGDAPWDVYIVRTDGRWISKAQTPLNEDEPTWSPDGRRVAYFAWKCPGSCSGWHGWVYTMTADGTHRRRLARATSSTPRWSPDGRRIAYAYDGIYVMNADGSGKRRLTRSGVGAIGGGDVDPVWSPDGTRIAFSHGNHDGFDVEVVAAGGGQPRALTHSHDAEVAAWSPGRQIIFTRNAGGTLAVVGPDGSGLRNVAAAAAYDSVQTGGWSPDGQLIVYAAKGISTVRPSDGLVERLTRDSEQRGPAWSPDGRRISFTRSYYATTKREPGIWIVNRDGTGAHRIATDGWDDFQTAWAPRANG